MRVEGGRVEGAVGKNLNLHVVEIFEPDLHQHRPRDLICLEHVGVLTYRVQVSG